MAGASLALALIGGGTSILGGFMEAGAARQEGEAQASALEFEAKQLDQRSKQELAAGQQKAQEAQKQKRLMLSQLQNRAAASGFSATDASNLQLAMDIDERGELQAGLSLFEGQLQHDNLVNHAGAKRASASNVKEGARLRGNAGVIGGFSSGMGRFAEGIRIAQAGDPRKGNLRYG